MFLKSLFLCVVLIGYSDAETRILKVPKEMSDAIVAAIRTCFANPEDIPDFLSLLPAGKYKEDAEYKNILYCSLLNSGIIHKDGTKNIEYLVQQFPEDLDFHKAMRDCATVGPNEVETAYLSFKCFQDKSPVLLHVQTK